MNVVGSRPDGWWRDRRGAKAAFAERLGAFARDQGEQVAVVFDGRPFDVDAEPAEVEFAPGGPGAADDAIAARVAADADPAGLTVVTSDRELVGRVREHGAEVMGSREFRTLLGD